MATQNDNFILPVCMTIITSLAAVYTSMQDTPPNKAAVQMQGLQNDSDEISLKKLKEDNKKLGLLAKTGALQQGSSSVGIPGVRAAFPLGGNGEYFLAPSRDYLITGDGENVAASIGYRAAPHSSEGAYLVRGCGQQAWTASWSSATSPVDPKILMQQCVGIGQNIPYIEVIPRGTVRFNFN